MQKKYNRFKKIKIIKKREKKGRRKRKGRKKKLDSIGLQKPKVEAEVYNNNKKRD